MSGYPLARCSTIVYPTAIPYTPGGRPEYSLLTGGYTIGERLDGPYATFEWGLYQTVTYRFWRNHSKTAGNFQQSSL